VQITGSNIHFIKFLNTYLFEDFKKKDLDNLTPVNRFCNMNKENFSYNYGRSDGQNSSLISINTSVLKLNIIQGVSIPATAPFKMY